MSDSKLLRKRRNFYRRSAKRRGQKEDLGWKGEKGQKTNQDKEDAGYPDDLLPELIELGADQIKEPENKQIKDDTNEANYSREEPLAETDGCNGSQIPPTVVDKQIDTPSISDEKQFVSVGTNTDPEDGETAVPDTKTTRRLAKLDHIIKKQEEAMVLLKILTKEILKSK